MGQINEKHVLDRKFLEFWGNMFLNIAKGQEHIEQISSVMNMDSITNMDFMNFKEMARMFRQSYGLPLDESGKKESEKPNLNVDGTETLKLNESLEAFQSSFTKYVTIWGWIPKKTHDELKQSYESLQQEYNILKKDYDNLKQKSDIQEEIISQLRDILNAKGMGSVELFQHIQNLTRKQTDEVQNLIQNLQNIFKIRDNKS
ncbi:MAG: hypothetical protein HQK70_02100 [Desulfamplus sp.]|nr:hypothetical protein [Desulfamplus sp.]